MAEKLNEKQIWGVAGGIATGWQRPAQFIFSFPHVSESCTNEAVAVFSTQAALQQNNIPTKWFTHAKFCICHLQTSNILSFSANNCIFCAYTMAAAHLGCRSLQIPNLAPLSTTSFWNTETEDINALLRPPGGSTCVYIRFGSKHFPQNRKPKQGKFLKKRFW